MKRIILGVLVGLGPACGGTDAGPKQEPVAPLAPPAVSAVASARAPATSAAGSATPAPEPTASPKRVCEWRGRLKKSAVGLFADDGSPLATTTTGIEGEVRITAVADGMPKAHVTAHGFTLDARGALPLAGRKSGNVGLRLKRAALFGGFAVPLPHAVLALEKTHLEAGTADLRLILTTRFLSTQPATFDRTFKCSDLTLDEASFDAKAPFEGLSEAGEKRYLSFKELKLYPAPGEKHVAEVSGGVFGAVRVPGTVHASLKSKRRVTMVLGDTLISGWINKRWVSRPVPPPETEFGMFGILNSGAGAQPTFVTCDKPVPLNASTDGKQHRLGVIAPGTSWRVGVASSDRVGVVADWLTTASGVELSVSLSDFEGCSSPSTASP